MKTKKTHTCISSISGQPVTKTASQRRSQTANLTDAAYYHAAQAVVGWCFGWSMFSVEIGERSTYTPVGGEWDGAPFSEIPDQCLKAYAQDLMTRTAAGVAALQQLHPNAGTDTFWARYGAADLSAVEELASECADRCGEDLLDETGELASQLVLAHWDKIRWLAEALVKSRILRGKAVLKAMADPDTAADRRKLKTFMASLRRLCGRDTHQSDDSFL